MSLISASSPAAQTRPSHEVLSLLGSLRDQRVLLQVRLEGAAIAFQSAVVALEDDALLLDELVPRHGHERVAVGTELEVAGILRGVPLSFRQRVAGIATDEGGALYRLPFPGSIEYQQRREGYRVPVSRGEPIVARLEPPEAEALVGELHDLSSGGCAIRLRFAEGDGVERLRGAPGLRVAMALGEEGEVSAEYALLHAQPLPSGTVLVGGALLDLDATGRALLRRAVARLERRQARRRPK